MLTPVPQLLLESPPLTGCPFLAAPRARLPLGSLQVSSEGQEEWDYIDLEIEFVPCRGAARTYLHRNQSLRSQHYFLKHSEGWIEGRVLCPPPASFCSQLLSKLSSSPPMVSTWQLALLFLNSLLPPCLQGMKRPLSKAIMTLCLPCGSLQSSFTPPFHLICEAGRVGSSVPTCQMTELRAAIRKQIYSHPEGQQWTKYPWYPDPTARPFPLY